MISRTGPIRLLAIVCCMLHSWAAAAVCAELGERFAIEGMLAQTGASGGIVSYVGRPDADDLAKLSANYRFVHVLEGDAGRADQLDKQLYERGLRGKVSVMRWRESHLPYADDLVNLVVMRTSTSGRTSCTAATIMPLHAIRGLARRRLFNGPPPPSGREIMRLRRACMEWYLAEGGCSTFWMRGQSAS